MAFQICPLGHSHHAVLRLPAVTCSRVRVPFRVGCHWAAISGASVAKSLKSGRALCPAQTGQPAPPQARAATDACQTWPFSHCTRPCGYSRPPHRGASERRFSWDATALSAPGGWRPDRSSPGAAPGWCTQDSRCRPTSVTRRQPAIHGPVHRSTTP